MVLSRSGVRETFIVLPERMSSSNSCASSSSSYADKRERPDFVTLTAAKDNMRTSKSTEPRPSLCARLSASFSLDDRLCVMNLRRKLLPLSKDVRPSGEVIPEFDRKDSIDIRARAGVDAPSRRAANSAWVADAVREVGVTTRSLLRVKDLLRRGLWVLDSCSICAYTGGGD